MALAGVGNRFFGRFYDQPHKNGYGVMKTVGKILGSGALAAPGLNLLPLPQAMREYGGYVFEPVALEVWIDGKKLEMREYRALNIASIDLNLARLFRLFPHAREQGVMHVQAGNPGVFDMIRALPAMISGGKNLPIKEFIEQPGRHLRLKTAPGESLSPVIDGEIFDGLIACDIRRGPQVDVIRLVADPTA